MILQVALESADIQQVDFPPPHQVQQASLVIDQSIEANEDATLISIEVEESPVREREYGELS